MLLRNQSQNIDLLYNRKETKYKSLETFIENMEKGLFKPENIKLARSNLSTDEKKALKVIKLWDDKLVRVQVKGSIFVILENKVYEE